MNDPSDQMPMYTREQISAAIDELHMTGDCPDELVQQLASGDKDMVRGLVNSVFESAKNDLRRAFQLPEKCPCGVATCLEPFSDVCGFTEAENHLQQTLDLVPAEESDDVAVPPQTEA